jgi:hypothetical protein
LGKATEALEREHQVIQKAVAVMAKMVDQLEALAEDLTQRVGECPQCSTARHQVR